jgi:hypothetical protein
VIAIVAAFAMTLAIGVALSVVYNVAAARLDPAPPPAVELRPAWPRSELDRARRHPTAPRS